MRAIIVAASVLLLNVVLTACTTQAPGEGEGEGDPAGEGEGEGEGEEEPTLPDVGAPPAGFTGSVPTGGHADACSTGQWWDLGDRESETMHPGNNCILCHSQEGGPSLAVGGTVMGRFHDENDCRGIPGVDVEIIDANGASVITLTTNEAGNFFAGGDINSIPLPYTITLHYEGRTRSMLTGQTSGNCMECHTDTGANAAPGRILLP